MVWPPTFEVIRVSVKNSRLIGKKCGYMFDYELTGKSNKVYFIKALATKECKEVLDGGVRSRNVVVCAVETCCLRVFPS